MVNPNHGHGHVRVGVQPDGPPLEFAANDGAAGLDVGDEVLPNYVDKAAREEHASGVILSIEDGNARVRWEPGDRTQTYPLEHLIKR